MLQSKAPQPSRSGAYSVAGKVFLLGEYAVLAGLPALVAAVPPRFRLSVSPESAPAETLPTFPHAQSPMGRLRTWALNLGLPDPLFYFEDPLQGAGGFGASTAQFAMAYLAYLPASLKGNLNAEKEWSPVWKLYRELMGDEPLAPSGADLVIQWQGGVGVFDPSGGVAMDSLRYPAIVSPMYPKIILPAYPTYPSYKNVWKSFDWSQLLIFSATEQAGRKVPTHEHLALLSKKAFLQESSEWIDRLETILRLGLAAVDENDALRLGSAFDLYAEALFHAGFEVSATTEDRRILRQFPGVLGVKGTGAMQSDAIVVLMDSGSRHKDQVIEAAQNRGLRCVSDGLAFQKGILCLNSE